MMTLGPGEIYVDGRYLGAVTSVTLTRSHYLVGTSYNPSLQEREYLAYLSDPTGYFRRRELLKSSNNPRPPYLSAADLKESLSEYLDRLFQ